MSRHQNWNRNKKTLQGSSSTSQKWSNLNLYRYDKQNQYHTRQFLIMLMTKTWVFEPMVYTHSHRFTSSWSPDYTWEQITMINLPREALSLRLTEITYSPYKYKIFYTRVNRQTYTCTILKSGLLWRGHAEQGPFTLVVFVKNGKCMSNRAQ